MTGRAEIVVVSALAAILTLAVAAPVMLSPSQRIFGMEIVGRHHDPFTVMEQFGRPIASGLPAQPVTDLAGALLAGASGPIAAYNWLVLLTFPLSAAAAYALARYLALPAPWAAAAAIAFAFSPFHLAQAAYHPHIAQTQWMPLYLLGLWRALDDSAYGSTLLLAAASVGLAFSNAYAALIAALITPVALAGYWYFGARSATGSTRRLCTTIATLAAIAAAGAAYAVYLGHAGAVNPAGVAYPRLDLFRYSASWWSYLVPPVAHPLLGDAVRRFWSAAGVSEGLLEQQVSLGCGIVLLGLAAVVAWLTGQSGPTALRFVPVLALTAAVALVCSLSPERAIGAFSFMRPSAVLYPVLPMFRSYARFGVVVQLMAVLLAAIGAEWLWQSRRRRIRIGCIVLVVLAAAEYAVWPPSMWRDVLPTKGHRWVVQQPAVTQVLDCSARTAASESVQWLSAQRITLRDALFDDCRQPNLAAKLAAAGYSHLLVDRHSGEGDWFATRKAADGLTIAARFRDSAVFTVTARPPPVYTARMRNFYPREYDEQRTWRWMGPQSSWTVVNRSDRDLTAVLELEITAFGMPRRLQLILDGRDMQELLVPQDRAIVRVRSLTLSPGEHELVFRPAEPAAPADRPGRGGDPRPLSFAVGTWWWKVEGFS